MTATPGAHPVQDRFAIGGEVERLWYHAGGFQQPSPQTSLDLTAEESLIFALPPELRRDMRAAAPG